MACIFCHTEINDEVNLGKLMPCRKINVHYYCVLLSASVTQSGKDNEGVFGFTYSDIIAEEEKCKRNICYYCKKGTANLKCHRRNCRRKFHLPCGLRYSSTHEFIGSYHSFCHTHGRIPKIPTFLKENLRGLECSICYDTFGNIDLKSVYAPKCCNRKTAMHIKCVKKLALNAGYFTRCPICNNEEKFLADIKLNGVFVPSCDASWEKDRNAYSGLLERYSRCDARKCYCNLSGKRNYVQSGDGKKWSLILCQTCGSSGIHMFCNNQKSEYACSACEIEDETDDTVEEPLARYSRCDAEECYCRSPGKRSYAERNGRSRWSLILCHSCGSSGIHRYCNNKKTTYVCSNCTMKDTNKEVTDTPVALNEEMGKAPNFVEEPEQKTAESELDIKCSKIHFEYDIKNEPEDLYIEVNTFKAVNTEVLLKEELKQEIPGKSSDYCIKSESEDVANLYMEVNTLQALNKEMGKVLNLLASKVDPKQNIPETSTDIHPGYNIENKLQDLMDNTDLLVEVNTVRDEMEMPKKKLKTCHVKFCQLVKCHIIPHREDTNEIYRLMEPEESSFLNDMFYAYNETGRKEYGYKAKTKFVRS